MLSLNTHLSILRSDIKNALRDPTLLLLLWVPLMIFLVVRFGLPILFDFLPESAEYIPIFISFFSLMNAVLPGIILSFMLLDEKDLHILPNLTVTPVSLSGILYLRVLFFIVFGFLCSLGLLLFNNQMEISFSSACAISVLNALNAPIFVLTIAALAKNKVEGLTFLKAANITLIIPAGVFFIHSYWEYLLSIFPGFWTFKCIESPDRMLIHFVPGTLILLCYNYAVLQFAIKRMGRLG